MANNVYCNLQLNKANNDSETEWKRAFSLLSIDKGLEFLDIYRTNEETPDGSFMDEFIGARSAELIDMNFDVCTKNDYIFEHEIKSSWTPPLKFFEELGLHLYDFDPKVSLSLTYHDEFYNFAGVIVFVDGYLFQEEQSGGWFTELQNEQGRDPRDFQDFVEENLIKWRRDLLNEIGLQ